MNAPPEADVIDAIEARLVALYGEDAVSREPRLPSDREPDFLVDAWPVTLAIEVENTAEEAIYGAGQAAMYAGEANAHPLVLFPAGTGEEQLSEELTALRKRIPIEAVEVDHAR